MGVSRQEHWSGVPLPSPEEVISEWLWDVSIELIMLLFLLIMLINVNHYGTQRVQISQ